jgi:hypothetical protein
MSNDDELERLLREVDASLSGGAVAPKGGQVAKPAATDGAARAAGRSPVRTGLVAGAASGVVVLVGATLLSILPGDQAPFQAGLGAFVGAFLTGAVLSLRGRG